MLQHKNGCELFIVILRRGAFFDELKPFNCSVITVTGNLDAPTIQQLRTCISASTSRRAGRQHPAAYFQL